MLQKETMLEVADNSGAKKLKIIGILNKSNCQYAEIGDIITATIRDVKPDCAFKKGQIVTALIVSTCGSLSRRQQNEVKVSYTKNYAVLVKKEGKKKKIYKPLGTRVFSPLLFELNRPEYKEIFSLAPEII